MDRPVVDLSIIIVNWNTRELLRVCLRSLQSALATSALSAETIVVDNASSDGSAAMVAAEFPACRLIANEENRNYAAGNNQGLGVARGEFRLLLNPDTEVPPGALGALICFLREHPRAGAVAPALVGTDGLVQSSVRGFPTPAGIAGALTGLARMFPKSGWGSYRVLELPQDRPSSVGQPMASAFLIRREALTEIGVFDEQFPLFFNDVDLCYRLKEAGWEIWYEPAVKITHVGGASTRQVRPAAIRQSHEGMRRFYRKHYRGRVPAPAYGAIMISISVAGWVRASLAELRAKGRKAG